jgi:hypothetical protein
VGTEIISVDLLDHEPDALWGFGLDAPAAGRKYDTYSFDVLGWALGRRAPVRGLRLFDGDRLLWRVPPDVERPAVIEAHPEAAGQPRPGFFAVVNSLNLDRDFQVRAEVRLTDDTVVGLADIRGRRDALTSDFDPALDPVMVTTLGRTGSTILMKVLDTHPEVVAYRPFEHEPRVATYWMGVLRSLGDPASYRRQINPTGTLDGTWWTGTDLPLPRRVKDDALTRLMGVTAVRELAGFCQQRIDGLYSEVAADGGRSAPRFFAEKFRPDRIPELMWELYPQAREVILVRDFRDMVASMFAYNAKRGVEGFRRSEYADDADYVVQQIAGGVKGLAATWAARRDRAHLIRYEDLVLQPEPAVAALLSYLGLDHEGPAADAMVKSLTAREAETEGHRTTPDPRASIGRWRQDLTPAVRRACEQALAHELETFGYSLEEAA